MGAVTRLTHKRGTATIMASVLWLECLLTQTFIPWALLFVVPRYGQTFRYADRLPHFNLTIALVPLLFLIGALIFDGIMYLQRNMQSLDTFRSLWLPGAIIAVFAVIVPPAIAHLLIASSAVYIQPDVIRVLTIGWGEQLVALLPAIVLSIGSAMLGAFFGDIFYRSEI